MEIESDAASPRSGAEILELLRREDKHYLGAGDGVLFDATQPLWLDHPGFWDAAHFYLHALQPGFTVSFLRSDGGERLLRLESRSWTPAALAARYVADGLVLEERRAVLPGGHLVSEWRVQNRSMREAALHAVAWTAHESGAIADRAAASGGRDGVSFTVMLPDAQGRLDALGAALRLRFARSEANAGWAILEAQHARGALNRPDWQSSPLRDRWLAAGLPSEARLGSADPAGRTLIHFGIAKALRVPARGVAVFAVVLTIRPAEKANPRGFRETPLPAGVLAAAADADWATFFDGVPALSSDDPHLEHYFPYRWYGLRLNYLSPAGRYRYPTVAEGVEYFHCAIAYSAWCHMRELRWHADPRRAQGALLTFLDHQQEDGMLPGRVYLTPGEHTDFYFADWGGSLLALHAVHPDPAFLRSAYAGLARYAEWLDADRDPEESGLYTVRDPYETGQENMSRYTAVDPEADRQHFDFRLRLKGVDATVYAYRLRRALARAAAELGESAEVRAHDGVADRIAEAVREHMWDAADGMFSDVDPRSFARTGVKAAVCFYPYMTDIVGESHLAGLQRHLFDPAEFWLPYPVPSTAADDPTFDPDATWRGVRRSCAWNGRVWPMTNSHLCEALACAAGMAPQLRLRAGELLMRYIRMLCFDGDPARPNSFEHYSPLTGRASIYRGIDDYQHSWINDLVVQYIFGIRPRHDGSLRLEPLPCGLRQARLHRLPFRGRLLEVELHEDTVRLIGGGRVLVARSGEAAEVRW